MTRRIPLFPLNTVLFPGMMLPLHIFEPRYREMIADCMAGDRLFGVCLIRRGAEVGEAAEPYRVGTTCEITRVTPLEDGRLLLETIGRDRFRIRALAQDRAYLEGEIELIPEEGGPAPDALVQRVRDRATLYVQALLTLHDEEQEVVLPEDGRALSHLIGAVLQIPLPEQQQLLAEDSLTVRLEHELRHLNHQLEELLPALEKRAKAAVPFEVRPEHVCLN